MLFVEKRMANGMFRSKRKNLKIGFPNIKPRSRKIMRWILNHWIGRMADIMGSRTDDIIRYRGIEIAKNRLEEIKQPLLNDVRKWFLPVTVKKVT